MKIRFIYIFCAIIIIGTLFSGVQGYCQDIKKLKTVVIDAGHGGRQGGTSHGGVVEKEVNLKVALKLGRLIEDNYPDVKVLYTRKTDIEIDLWKRINMAVKNNADLFISIHVNAQDGGTSAKGTSTYTLGMHKTAENFNVAKRENSVITMEQDASVKYEGFDPSSPESYIMFSLMQYTFSEQSLQFAAMIEDSYKDHTGLASRGVKQAGFLVLVGATMPAILTEMGFMTNPDDRKFIASDAGQNKFANSLFKAFAKYKAKYEGSKELVLNIEDIPVEDIKNDTLAEIDKDKFNESLPVYMIQIMSIDQKLPAKSKQLKGYAGKAEVKYMSKRYKYFVEPTNSYQKALEFQSKVGKQFKGAFIVAFKDGQIISLDQARKLEQKNNK